MPDTHTKPKTCFVHITGTEALHSEHADPAAAEYACIAANLAASKLGLSVTYTVCDKPYAQRNERNA